MMFTIYRSYLDDRTVGKLYNDGNHVGYTLERPALANCQNISCIPEGLYRVKRDRSGKHRYYALKNVTNRSAIEVHNGTIPTHSDGCILIGYELTHELNLRGLSDPENQILEMFDNLEEFDLLITHRGYWL